jgi:hypothetical protein
MLVTANTKIYGGSTSNGWSTNSFQYTEHSISHFNPAEKGKYTFIIGNGETSDNRSNAYALDWEGNGWFAGDVYVDSASGTDKDEGSEKLARLSDISKNEFNAIILKSSTAGSSKKFRLTIDDNGSFTTALIE